MSRKLNQKGFTAVETLLVVIVLLLIGFIGYYVYHANHKEKKPEAASKTTTAKTNQKKAADQTSTVALTNDGQTIETLQIPDTWTATVAHHTINSSSRTPSCSLTVYNQLNVLDYGSAIPTALANDANKPEVDFDVVKQPDTKSLQDYFTDDLYGGTDAGIHTFTDMTINGNPAVLYNGSGQPDGSDYKQQYYLVSHNGYVGCLRWRYFDSGPPVQDYSQYLNDVKSMAQSIQFPN
ncbi:MAG TPA: hypothetical protein VHA37_04935 [Candidatus Saccharimonadales bacterium]|nr:hypothetical protein [Candidatus Saccharimonadales bacterium]